MATQDVTNGHAAVPPGLIDIFTQLVGTWRLDRRLESANDAEPSGKCVGTANFTARDPSVFVADDGKLDTAIAEMVYCEQGEFEMYQTSSDSGLNPRFAFSRKYVWRLQKRSNSSPLIISIWFTKPGTEQIDYLFHKVDLQSDYTGAISQSQKTCTWDGNGGHLCEEDFYSSSYSFNLQRPELETDLGLSHYKLDRWTMLHEVRGPQKDQVIETNFTRS